VNEAANPTLQGGFIMNGNICPKCGKSVMSYGRFLKEAEPYKISKCGSCGVDLKRNPRVYVFLLVMVVILALVTTPMFMAIAAVRISSLAAWLMAAAWLTCWGLLINHLSWRYVGWVIANRQEGESHPASA
jgi:uncharacterized protein (DUF983 family)